MWSHKMEGEGRFRFIGSYDYVRIPKTKKMRRYFVLYKANADGNISSGSRKGTFTSPQQAKRLGWKKV